MRVADTSALYALLNDKDPHHTRAKKAFDDVEPIQVPVPILVETVDLVGYRHGPSLASEALALLLGLPHLSLAAPVHMDAVVQIHHEGKGGLSLADAYVVQTCRALGARPLAFDKDIVRYAKGHA